MPLIVIAIVMQAIIMYSKPTEFYLLLNISSIYAGFINLSASHS